MKTGRMAVLGGENLALAVLDVLLQVKRHRLRSAEILHGLRHGEPHVLAQLEEMVYRILAGENDGLMVQNIHLRLTKLHSIHPFNLEKLVEINVDAVFALQVRIRRLLKVSGSILGN